MNPTWAPNKYNLIWLPLKGTLPGQRLNQPVAVKISSGPGEKASPTGKFARQKLRLRVTAENAEESQRIFFPLQMLSIVCLLWVSVGSAVNQPI